MTVEMPGIIIRIIFSILILAFLYMPFHRACGIFIANRLVLNAPTLESYSQAIQYDPSNSEFLWLRGRIRQFSIDSIDIPGAIEDYKKALQLNPRVGQAWLDLADCYENIGETDKAEKALQNALRVWTYSPSTRWQAGNFYLMRGDLDKMYQCFKIASLYDIGKLDAAIRMAWKVDPDRAAIYRKLIPDTFPAKLTYFNFLISQNELDPARPVWEGSLASPVPVEFDLKVAFAFSYIDKLLARDLVEDALQVWQQALRKSGTNLIDSRIEPDRASAQSEPGVNLVWNGSFENEILRGGWDWRFEDSREYEFQTDLEDRMDGLRSLKLAFGGANIDFAHFSQVIPTLVPGAYQLEFYVKTDRITTDQRPYILVRGFPDPQGASARSDMFPESSPWKKYEIPFTVGPGAKAIQLLLRRESSRKFDNQIEGTLWMDKISVRRWNSSDLR